MSIDIYEVTWRTIAAFIVLYFLCRVLGKKQIMQLTFFDFVSGITIGSIVANLVINPNVTLTNGLVALSVFCLIVLLIDYSVLKSISARKFFSSEPTLVIKDGKILGEGMRKERLNNEELLFLLRKKGIFYLDEVELAFFETDGSLSTLRKQEKLPAYKEDVHVHKPKRGLPQTFIIDGQLMKNSLASLGKDINWVKTLLSNNSIKDLKDVNIAQMDEQGNLYLDMKDDKLSEFAQVKHS
ncbi:DUF421 domain-containing protein [Anaerobacillus sp. CMMVII]|uniref:DUF421 domain-containing protein n=1 Tax=Anaerobacillus sp. CMMVII TaxID=2755588 RepID=UPI0021B7CD08|nr:DUF421 domain-containing protein [Anaerobacillus sp. CMMVII]MCT8138958.1 DUF421 domain-containing protein [Anaerobacillus sp. CMMVII]